MHSAGDVSGVRAGCSNPFVSTRPDFGFSRLRRIIHGSDYQRIFAGGRRKAGRYQVLWVAASPVEVPRVGVVASKRTFRRAVDRARAKRLLREAFRLNRSCLEPHTDCVLVARRAILGAGRADVERDLIQLASRCRVVRGSGDGQ